MNALGTNGYSASQKPRGILKIGPIAAACATLVASLFMANSAYSNAGFGTNTNIAGQDIAVPTFYANSPQGWQFGLGPHNMPITVPTNPATGSPFTVAEALSYNQTVPAANQIPLVDTGRALRKFVDQLPGLYNGLSGFSTPGLNGEPNIAMGIPLAVRDQWVDSNLNPVNGNTDDYYEIAVVEYTQRLHSDLAKPTRMRGYVQIETPNIVSKGLKDATGATGSEHIPGTYLDGTPILDAKGNQVYFVHTPHFLGPSIVATKGKPVRVLFRNYLPYTDADGKPHGNSMGGELPVPVDEYIAGGGPLVNGDGSPYLVNGKPVKFGQNRASIHFHGGDTPWISDGTPHQWFAPAGDVAWSLKDAAHPNGLGQGDSHVNVPDMPDPGPGAQTLFFPNNQSGRMMWYHDHTLGLTKLNVYMGMASSYIITDPVEQKLASKFLRADAATQSSVGGATVNTGALDAIGIPLVIQDKTFVPKNMGPGATNTAGQVQSQDSKWDQTHWGAEGDVFFPHVYEVNQDPNSVDGTNPVGRWDWGPWFWPVFPAQYSLPSGNYGDATATPEAFVDTAMVNGVVYPTMTVDPKTYRFRILNAANDRGFNFGIYQAVDANGVICDANNPNPAVNAAAPGELTAPATCTEMAMVPAATTSNLPASWPTDGRPGGVPDPRTIGPDIVQIGNETGLLPAPIVWSAQPVTFDQNVRSMTVLNVLNHQLTLMAAERADVLIDFSKYAGKTLILYNDAPAPFPGFDPRIDYFTGVGDQSGGGGAYDTLPGYGPNTRTVMQIKVNAATPAQALDVAQLTKDLPVAYATSRPKPIVPETAYNVPFPSAANSTDNYARIFTGSKSAPSFKYAIAGAPAGSVQIGTENVTTGLLDLTGAVSVAGGSGYTTVPNVTFSTAPVAINGVLPTATATVSGGVVTAVKIANMDAGYFTSQPTINIDAPPAGGVQATATIVNTVPAINRVRIINKAIQELFDPVYGRMNATLAVELPYSSATVATTIPLAYIDTPVDYYDGIAEGETQIWKITHNGVDSHPVHFHLVNVQVLNRVDWAGVVKPPAASEVGWRETLRMNPLEDVYVAVRAERPVAPFGVPRSQRTLDSTQVIGSQLGFTQIDPLTGNAPIYQTQLVNGVSVDLPTTVYSNQMTDFDNEYVWHCHILGHEENDFMRPFIFHPSLAVPDAPGLVALDTSTRTVSWSDPTPYGGVDAQGNPTAGYDTTGKPVSNPKNEIGFRIYPLDANGNALKDANSKTIVFNAIANATSFTLPDTISAASVVVTAYNAVGESKSGLQSALASGGSYSSDANALVGDNAQMALGNIAATTGLTTSQFTGAAAAAAATAAAATTDSALAASAPSAPAAVSQVPNTPAGVVSLQWANNALNVDSATGFTNVTGYTLSWGNQSWNLNAVTAKGLPNGATIQGLTTGVSYTFTLVANNALNASTLASAGTQVTVVAP